MGYNSECDGYSRAWMPVMAASRRDLDQFLRGANRAKAELEETERRVSLAKPLPLIAY